MKMKLMMALGLFVLAALAGAQGRGGMMGQRGGGGAFLLQRPDVQADLKLTAEQKQKLEAAGAEMRTAMEGMRGQMQNEGDREAAMQEMTKLRRANDEKVKAILTPEQSERLKEIEIQMAGNRAVLRPDVQEKLGLTEEQKAELRAMQEEQQTAMRDTMERVRNQEIDREEAMADREKMNKEMDAAIGEILTQEQKDKLKAMGGAPFKMDPNWRPERGG